MADVLSDTSRSASRRPRRRTGENRERLISAGIAEFGLRGFHGASTATVAQRADVPQPHIYTNFRTKHELFLECAREVVERLIRQRLDPVSRESAADDADGPQATSATSTPPAAPSSTDDEAKAGEQADRDDKFVLQAYAALAEPGLGPELSQLLANLEQGIGQDRLTALMSRAMNGMRRRTSV